MASVVIMHARHLPELGEVARDVQAALGGRVVVEQAKGVLMALDGVDAGRAFSDLVERAQTNGHSLATQAQDVLRRAEQGRRESTR